MTAFNVKLFMNMKAISSRSLSSDGWNNSLKSPDTFLAYFQEDKLIYYLEVQSNIQLKLVIVSVASIMSWKCCDV